MKEWILGASLGLEIMMVIWLMLLWAIDESHKERKH